MADQFPPLSIDNPPSNAMCGCGCGCRKPLNKGNAMAQELASEYDAPADSREAFAETTDEREPNVIWHVDPATINPEEWANAPVVLLICADCFVGNHGASSLPNPQERPDD